ncbi:hypothetical protein HZD82_26300, partial [Pantoea agglomerans]|nr:hypothetical protein [Pantoea agglomerans]
QRDCVHQRRDQRTLPAVVPGQRNNRQSQTEWRKARQFSGHPRVVVARTRAALRRSGRIAQADPEQEGWRFGGWQLDDGR